MIRFPLGLVAVGLLAALAGCREDGPRPARLVLTGSSTVAPLAAEIGKRFESLHPGVRVDVQTGGSSRGIADVRRGLADIGMASRALRQDEADLRSVTIARDGICLIVHSDNPVRELTRQQVVAIYTGAVRSWQEVGGPEAPITVVHKAEGRSTLELFLEHFRLDNVEVQPSVVIGDNEQGIKTVIGDPNAIGYVSIGAAEVARGRGGSLRLLPLDGIAASTESLADGTFPLARPLNLVLREEPSGWGAELLDFARSPAVADLVAELNFAPASGT